MAAKWKSGDSDRMYQRYLHIAGNLYNSRQDIRVFTEVLLTLVGMILFGVFAIRPTLVTISKLWTEVKEKEQVIATMDEKINNLDRAQGLYSQEKQNIDLLKLAMPEIAKPEDVMKQIEAVAAKNGLEVFSEDVGEVVIRGAQPDSTSTSISSDDKDLTPIPQNSFSYKIGVSVRGEYGQLLSFLKEMENMRRPIYLDKVDFVIQKELSEEFLQLSISGRVLFYSNEQ